MRLLTTIAAITATVQAQGWAARQDGSGDEQTLGLSADQQGNVYAAGFSTSPVLTIYDTFGYNISSYLISGVGAAFLIKYTSAGSIAWTAMQDGAGNDKAYAVTTDSLGNVFVCGTYLTSPLTVYDARGLAVKSLLNNGGLTGYVVKYASNGSFIWAARQDSGTDDSTLTVSTNKQDELFVGGSYSSLLQVYDAQDAIVQGLTLTGTTNSFLVKYAGNGSFVWALKLDNSATSQLRGCAVDWQDNVLVTGSYQAILSVYDARGSNVKTLGINGLGGSFGIKFSSNGSFIWATRQDGTGFDYGMQSSVSSSLVYIVGYYTATIQFYDAKDNSIKSMAKQGLYGAYVAAYLYNGSFAWGTLLDGAGQDRSHGCVADIKGNIIISGYYEDSPTVYDLNNVPIMTIPVNGLKGAFTVKYLANGSVAWAARQDGANVEYGFAAASDGMGNVYTSGYFQSQPLLIYDALGSLVNYSLPLSGSAGGFSGGYVVKYDQNGLWYNSTVNAGSLQVSTTQTSSSITTASTSVVYTSLGSIRVASPPYTMSTAISTSLSSDSTSASTVGDIQSSGLLLQTTAKLPVPVSNTVTNQLTEDQVQLIYLGGIASGSKSSVKEDLITVQQPLLSVPVNIGILVGVGVLLVCLLMLLLVCCLRRRRKSKSLSMITSESMNTTMMGQSTNMTTTMLVTSHVLAVPQFLVLQFGVDVRQLKQIARGGGGSVNHCQVLDPSKLPNYDKSQLVIKNLGKDISQLTDTIRRSFYQEISMLYMFRDQPYFAKMFGFTEQPATIVLKYYEQGSLMSLLLGQTDHNTRFPYSKRQVLLLQVKLGQGLAFMHSKLFAHCDVKPDNVLLEQVGQNLEPRISDFGISRLLDKSASQVQAFQLSHIRGASMRYAAPEVIMRFRQHLASDSDIWKAGDVYALSVVWLEMLTRREVWSLRLME